MRLRAALSPTLHCISVECPWLLSLTHSLCQWDDISWVLWTPNLETNMMSVLSSSSFLSMGMDLKSDCTKKQKCSERIRLCDYSGGSGKTSRGGHIWVVMMTEGEFSLWKKWGKRIQLARASWEEAGDVGLPGSSGLWSGTVGGKTWRDYGMAHQRALCFILQLSLLCCCLLDQNPHLIMKER